MSDYSQLAIAMRRLLGVLETKSDAALYKDVTAVCNYLENPVYRLGIFAPFNHGKSTLLNALLGSKTLPIDLIPTTGAGIIVGYGDELTTEITLKDGTQVKEKGVKILAQYAVLDSDRRMNSDVAQVRVNSPHPWLKTGVELLDLPGTNDREAQNSLVKDLLISADLVIQVLDARKLMTLEEKEHLTHWLQNRGIARVVFVVNFLNLLTPEEQQSVRERIYYVAESFRSDLPAGISNVYCVDALPALRARIKGDAPAAQATGLIGFESALQQIVSQQNNEHKLSRVIKIAQLLLQEAINKQQQLRLAKTERRAKSDGQIKVKQKASQLLQQGFDRSISDLRGWLYLPQLTTTYQAAIAIALAQTSFDNWLSQFRLDVEQQQQQVNKWIEQGSEFFAVNHPQLLAIDLLLAPVVQIPTPTLQPQIETETKPNRPNIPSELNKVLQGKVGTVVLGGASYILNKVAPKPTSNQQNESPVKISSQIYADAAQAYLQQFSDRANAQLDRYEQQAQQYLTYTPHATTERSSTEDYQLELLTNLINSLESELTNL